MLQIFSTPIFTLSFFLIAFGLGYFIARIKLLERSKLAEQKTQQIESLYTDQKKQLNELLEKEMNLKLQERELLIRLEEEKKSYEEKLKVFQNAEEKLTHYFKSISNEALKQNNQNFLDLAKQTLEKQEISAKTELEKKQTAIDSLIKPIKESLDKMDLKLTDLEKSRVGAYEAIHQQVKTLVESQHSLKSETSQLVQALRSPVVRGRWGEIQLKRVVEMAGMLEYCDFFQQESTETTSGEKLRPDLIIRLPGDKNIVIDAKAPLSAYLDALNITDENLRKERLKDHAKHIRTHMNQLSRKSYWDQFKPAPEFVVLFLPGEIFFSAALEQDPALIEVGVDQKVILATPTTLIALLRAVSYGWRQENLAKNAQKISDLGQELFKRISDMSDHLNRLGKNLNLAVDSFNKTVGTFESRVFVSARKFKELEAAPQSDEILHIEPIEQNSRPLL